MSVTLGFDFKIFDTCLEPIFVLTKNGEIAYCNEPAALILDSSPRKLVRSKIQIHSAFSFANQPDFFEKLHAVTEPTPYLETAFETAGGKSGRVQITVQPLTTLTTQTSNDSAVGSYYLAYFRDVTLEETLQKKYRAELEQKEDVIADLEKAKAELENYSKNLEKMVQERTHEIQVLNQTMKAMLDSLSQGFFVFNAQGDCLPVSSKACLSTLEIHPSDQKIWDIFKLKSNQVEGFKKWMFTLFSEMLPFEDIAVLGPNKYAHSEGKEIQLEYYPMRSPEGTIDGVVVVATDITALIQAKQEAEKQKQYADMIVNIVRYKQQALSFTNEAELLIKDLQKESEKPSDERGENLFRILHTLKGGAASFSIHKIAHLCHEAETTLSAWRQDPASVRWQDFAKVFKTIESSFASFLSENENILGNADRRKERWLDLPVSQLVGFSNQHLQNWPEAQSTFARELLMTPIGSFFSSYDAIVQSLAESDGRKVLPLVLKNSDLRIFPENYTTLFSTLIHAFRNAVDHGLETPEDRLQKGKPESGMIEVSFKIIEMNSKAKSLSIEIQDDGKGINPQAIRERLTNKGLDVSNESDLQIIDHIFDSQFSTKDQVTEISGRGVGMDAIRAAAVKLGGNATVSSVLGKGTCLKIIVPYFESYESIDSSNINSTKKVA